jgi:hypothetical protein
MTAITTNNSIRVNPRRERTNAIMGPTPFGMSGIGRLFNA